MQKFPLKKGLSDVNELHDEINEYINVLMGHINPPISDGIDTLFEVSSTYLARAKEIEIKLFLSTINVIKLQKGRIPSADNILLFERLIYSIFF